MQLQADANFCKTHTNLRAVHTVQFPHGGAAPLLKRSFPRKATSEPESMPAMACRLTQCDAVNLKYWRPRMARAGGVLLTAFASSATRTQCGVTRKQQRGTRDERRPSMLALNATMPERVVQGRYCDERHQPAQPANK